MKICTTITQWNRVHQITNPKQPSFFVHIYTHRYIYIYIYIMIFFAIHFLLELQLYIFVYKPLARLIFSLYYLSTKQSKTGCFIFYHSLKAVLIACETSRDWLDERSPLRAGSPVAKNFFQTTSLGIYTVKTRIDSCFIAENIWLLTFCHGFWWIRRSYSPIRCSCSILVY